ncbi:MAG TPA: 50S ribosomal protein L23 [Candidatus Norongarragalinales archaeon]|nr:50S ribosomal protein L23 [Candidatus Norongarragalinales archaeon]
MAILYALTTEKSAAMIERDNKMVFIVERSTTKKEVADEVLKNWGEKVGQVRVINGFNGKKKAIVKFVRKGASQDVAAKLKLI